jgi:hypothetical protein
VAGVVQPPGTGSHFRPPRKFFSRAKIRRRLERTTGTVLIALGIGLAVGNV